MSENIQKRPVRGILKNSSSFDRQDHIPPSVRKSKETKWDEMNIIATLHPADKDYGHMKIDEPKTPYNYDGNDSDQADGLSAEDLAERIKMGINIPAKIFEQDSDEEESDDDLSEEDKQKKREFELKRKKHYNEFYAIKYAKKLMEEDEEEEDDDDDDNDNDNKIGSSSSK